MKELSVKEKAKRYDEAIERYKAKQEYESQRVHEFIEYLFPELKESEDERIRKCISDVVKEYDWSHIFGVTKDDCLAWLEKKPSLLTKEKALKNSPFVEQNPVWSEEDEDYRLNANVAIDDYFDKEYAGALRDWLKSLKERVQPKVELTQLDKNILEAAIAFVEQNDHFNCCRGVDKHTVLSALRSLSTKNTWKPSDEQMKALDIAIRCGIQLGTWEETSLKDLYNDLKKL